MALKAHLMRVSTIIIPYSDYSLFLYKSDIGGEWKIDINVHPLYPLFPPEIKFVTAMCHPNVDWKVSLLCNFCSYHSV